MTTLAYRGGILAGDTLVTQEPNGKVGHDLRKVRRLRNGHLFGFSGSVEEGERLYQSLKVGDLPPKLKDINALMVGPDEVVWLYEGHMWVKQAGPYHAVGTGALCALSAMDAGASAVRAVRIAMKRDTYTGGRVLSVRLGKSR